MFAYTILTLNGRSFTFEADEVTEVHGELFFSLEGEVIGIFRKDALIGYYRQNIEIEYWDNEDGEDEDDYS